MKSKKLLFAAIAKVSPINFGDAPKTGLKTPGILNETYGKQSFVYIRGTSVDHRRALENALEKEGFKVGRDYFPGSTMVEVQVSYFKGHKWNE